MGPDAGGLEALIGREMAGYRLERKLGEGATSAVFLGTRVGPPTAGPDALPVTAAVKVLGLPWMLNTSDRAELRRRFLGEAEALRALRHPHILPLLGYGEDAATGILYMLLPHMANSLEGRLGVVGGPLPLDEVARYLDQVAAALDEAHGRGIVHRDVKPGNVLLDADGAAYLADFGIARLMEGSSGGYTRTGTVLGTPEYMAPEQARGEHVGPAADVYSLGILAYQMVTGRVPFQADAPMQVMMRHLQDAPPPPRAARPDLPVPAEDAILQALAKRTDERFKSAGAFARAFAEGLATPSNAITVPGGTISQFTSPRTVLAPPAPKPPVPRWMAAVAAVVLVAVVAGGVLLHGGQASSTLGAGSQAHATHAATSTSRGRPQPTARPPVTSTTAGGSSGGSQGSQNPPGSAPTNPPVPGPTATATAAPTPTFTPVPTPTFTPVPPTPVVKSIQIGWSSIHPSWIWMTFNNFPTGTYIYSCNFSTPPQSNAFTVVETTEPETWDNGRTCFDAQHGDNVWVIVNGVRSNTLTVP